jgi:hypothetical protein
MIDLGIWSTHLNFTFLTLILFLILDHVIDPIGDIKGRREKEITLKERNWFLYKAIIKKKLKKTLQFCFVLKKC